jgi:VanZ family protein
MMSLLKNFRLPWGVWLTVLIVWTGLLLTPGDWLVDQSKHQTGTLGIGKLLHVGFYFMLAALTGWLRLAKNWRLLLIPILMLHGGLTEWLQTFVPYREGAWRDVGLDSLSVLAGFLVTWPKWPASSASDEHSRSATRS